MTNEQPGGVTMMVMEMIGLDHPKPLTAREREIVPLIAQGLSNKEIARALRITEGTVKLHVGAILHKLGVRRRAGVALAASLGVGL